jgi:hypothetical protein
MIIRERRASYLGKIQVSTLEDLGAALSEALVVGVPSDAVVSVQGSTTGNHLYAWWGEEWAR